MVRLTPGAWCQIFNINKYSPFSKKVYLDLVLEYNVRVDYDIDNRAYLITFKDPREEMLFKLKYAEYL